MLRSLKNLFFGQHTVPCLPDGIRIYAIGDIHGRLDLLDALLRRISDDIKRAPAREVTYVFLGDYVDRGPRSAQVIERLIEHSRTHLTFCLRGNHENYLIDFLEHPCGLEEWARLGALPTLTSYGLKPSIKPMREERVRLSASLREVMPDDHKAFLANLPSAFTYGDYFFVHAGVRPGVPLTEQSEEDLLYIREEFLFYGRAFEKFIVHGHTPVKAPDKRFNRFNIDTGAYATGRLTVLCLESNIMRLL